MLFVCNFVFFLQGEEGGGGGRGGENWKEISKLNGISLFSLNANHLTRLKPVLYLSKKNLSGVHMEFYKRLHHYFSDELISNALYRFLG